MKFFKLQMNFERKSRYLKMKIESKVVADKNGNTIFITDRILCYMGQKCGIMGKKCFHIRGIHITIDDQFHIQNDD